MVFPFVGARKKLNLRQRWSRQLLDILAVRLDAQCADLPPGSLVLANHISWLDVFALNAVRPMAFVAKAEVRQWPLLGWLAATNETVFLRRGSRGHAKLVNEDINALLGAGRDVAVFPEGTTTDGTRLLGFHSALLQPALEAGCPIQPVTISYHDERGRRSLAPAYAGDTSLLECLRAILACRELAVRLRAAPPLYPSGQTRRFLAQTAHAAIGLNLGILPASNPPGTQPGLPDELPSSDVPTGNRNPEQADSVRCAGPVPTSAR